MSKLNFCGWTAGRAQSFFFRMLSNGSSSDIEDLAQSKSLDSMDVEYCFNHDLIVGDVDSAKKKQKSFGSELQLHNYFSCSAWVLTGEEKFHLLKDSDDRI
jgi:hypothetical protein